ncbi:class A sortase [Listeria aquatica]|uniref:class A sortase n=1 Tax=Listeria aquatica TaxID=1494960 RepID=UPI003EF90E4B
MKKKTKVLLSLLLVVLLAIGCGIAVFQYTQSEQDVATIQKQTKKKPKKWNTKVEKVDYQQDVDRPNLKDLAAFQQSKDYETWLKKAIGEIKIPSLHLQLPILPGTNNHSLQVGATTYREDQRLGQGNFVLLGHNMGKPGVLFSDLNQIKVGDRIQLTIQDQQATYQVKGKKIVSEKEGQVLANTQDARLTLITCDKATKTTHRIVILANLVQA